MRLLVQHAALMHVCKSPVVVALVYQFIERTRCVILMGAFRSSTGGV